MVRRESVIIESEHLYTSSDYHWIVKTNHVVNMIFNYLNPNVRTQLPDRYNLASAPVMARSQPSFPDLPDALNLQQDYLLGGSPELSGSGSDLDFIVKANDPIDRFIDSKKEVLIGSVNGILEQIYERLSIRDSNLYEIDQRIGRADSILDQLDVFELGALPVIDKRKAFIEKELITFEQEKRFEQVACWRDVSRLQGQLLELKQQIDTQANRQKLIND